MEKGLTSLKLGEARFYFTTDSAMTVGRSYAANLILSSSIESLQQQLQEILSEANPDIILNKDTSVLGKYIDAILEDGDSKTFDIEEKLKIGSRLLDSTSTLNWSWSVIPKNENPKGVLKIGLYFSKERFVDPENADNVDSEYYMVEVKAIKKSIASQFGNFMKNNWQWLASAIIIPLFFYWFTNRKKKKNQPA